ncbi:DUF4012 domain-containing protein [Candidatus Woesebacteria bacterium]|nr:DUF4012 domain-containing protein [Candidatus Woesebacteria bacterium]
MVATTNQLVGEEERSSALARIDGQDLVFIEPLREFLHQAGCTVVVNRETTHDPLYWIVAGDCEFVKGYVAGKKSSGTKRLFIVYDGDLSDEFLQRLGGKVVLVDPVPLTQALTRDVFSHFFTGKQIVYNARKGLGTKRVVSVIHKQQSREPVSYVPPADSQDSSRIAGIMKQIFAPSKVLPKHDLSFNRKWRVMKQVIFGLLVCIIIPSILYGVSCVLAVGFLYGGSMSLVRGNSKFAHSFITQSTRNTQIASTLLQLTSPVLQSFGLQGFAQDQELFLSVVADVAKSEVGVLRILDGGKAVAVSLLSGEAQTGQVKGLADVLALRSDVSQVAQHLALVQAQLDSLLLSSRFPFNIGRFKDGARVAMEKLVTLRQMTEYAQRLLTLYPEIGGFRKKQTYLVLLQNSMELRPTGGFIGSLLLVSFADGKLANLEVQDVYTADGQLKGHVDPPQPIQSLLGQEHWYLRDSNWDPDFSKSGPQAAWFYEKEMNTKVDGVIALSLPLVTKLLEVTGPLELSDFNERISAGNFFVKSLLYTQTDFFPGSTQKKDFLGSLTNALLMRLTTDKSISPAKLFSAIASSLEGRDVQFYFNDTNVQGIVSQWGWSGGVGFPSCSHILQDIPCVQDGIGIIQANLGVNKVNYFIKQQADSRIVINTTGDIRQETSMTLINSSTSLGHDGGGEYKSYVRFLYPADTELVSVSVDGQAVEQFDPRKQDASSSSVRVERLDDGVAIGVPVTVGVHAQKQIIVTTMRWGALMTKPTGVYQFSLRKQAGVTSTPWHVSIQYPDAWNANTDLKLAKPGVLEYNTDLVRDSQLKVLFTSSL